MTPPAILIPATPDAPGTPPRRPDGGLYRFELIDIDPRDDTALLRSLHHVGWIVLAERPEGVR